MRGRGKGDKQSAGDERIAGLRCMPERNNDNAISLIKVVEFTNSSHVCHDRRPGPFAVLVQHNLHLSQLLRSIIGNNPSHYYPESHLQLLDRSSHVVLGLHQRGAGKCRCLHRVSQFL